MRWYPSIIFKSNASWKQNTNRRGKWIFLYSLFRRYLDLSLLVPQLIKIIPLLISTARVMNNWPRIFYFSLVFSIGSGLHRSDALLPYLGGRNRLLELLVTPCASVVQVFRSRGIWQWVTANIFSFTG